LFENEVIKNIAKKYNKTIAQIALRWSYQHGFIILPKSKT
jgi:diketogulonate reductase-like aldo/keto reductase